jgi:hypothetical protein
VCLTLLVDRDNSLIDVENNLPTGFDYRGHRNNHSRILWGDGELVSDSYLSQQNECFEKEQWDDALQKCNFIIKMTQQ